ncbi:MAG: SRPBCC domain-containing protein [Rhizobiaceae bacterium]
MADERTLVIERTFGASPQDLFDAFRDPVRIVKWWGPEGATVPSSAFDVRIGGAWATTMRNRDGAEHHVSGTYLVLDPPRRIAFTWAWRQADGSRGHETVVDVVIAPDPAGARLTLTQKSFATAEHRDNHRIGWESSFIDLDRYLGRNQPADH